MSMYFAAACSPASSPLARALTASVPLRAANDNVMGFASDVMLREALRHFAEHGLRAAEQARQNAEKAFFADDRESYRWWLEICRMMDRRMATAVAARHGTSHKV